MTKDEILNMPAGREIDALIAKHVMKASYWENGATSDYNGTYPMYADWENRVFYYPSEGDGYLWGPSDNIADAWDVVEKMPLGFELRLHQHKIGDGIWQAEFHEPGSETFMVRAKTAPLAICRAALLSVLEEQNTTKQFDHSSRGWKTIKDIFR